MDSIVLYSEEIDEPDVAAEELFQQAETFSLKKNTLGILFAADAARYSSFTLFLRFRPGYRLLRRITVMTLPRISCSVTVP